jgi:uncharacterized protein (TIGR02246 family)
MDEASDRIAQEFAARYETAWTEGAESVSNLYTPDSVLVGYFTAIGRPEILKLLRGIINQGWTRIEITIVNVRKVGDLVLMANEYTAIGTSANAGKTLSAAASHVLAYTDGKWLSALHTAR